MIVEVLNYYAPRHSPGAIGLSNLFQNVRHQWPVLVDLLICGLAYALWSPNPRRLHKTFLTWIQEATLRNPESAQNMAPAPVCATLEGSSLDGAETACLPSYVRGMEAHSRWARRWARGAARRRHLCHKFNRHTSAIELGVGIWHQVL